MARFIINKGVLENVFTMDEEITIPEEVNKIDNYSFDVCSNLKRVIIDHRVNAKKVSIDYNEFFFLPSGITYVINGFSISWSPEEDACFAEKLFNSAMSGQITAELLQMARRRENKDPIYLHLCRQGQEDCLEYVKKSIMRFAKDAIDRDCIAELKEFDSYGFITKSNAGKLVEYALEKDNQNSGTVVCLLEIMDRTSGFKLEQLDKFLEKTHGNVEITAWLLECKNKHFTVEEIDKIETDNMEKELGLKERTLAEWKKIFSLDDDGNGGYIITGYKGEDTEIIIPDVIAKKKVTAIDEFAFSPEKDRLANKLKDIRGKITSVIIPDTVISISDRAFYKCRSLTSITIPDSVTSIGDRVFENCSKLTSITIPEKVTSIGENVFYWCTSLTSITISGKVKNIGDRAFEECSSLASITIPNSVTSIGESAFEDCCSLTSIAIPNSVTSIGKSAFSGCSSLTSITIPDTIITIEFFAFGCCSNLTSITIPNSVTRIGGWAFKDCTNLTNVTIPDTITSIGCGAFDGTKWNTDYPDDYVIVNGILIKYKGNEKEIVVPDTVTSIGDSAFENCSSLTSITIPDSVTSIGESAFSGCSSLTSITIPDSVTSIRAEAFYGTKWITDYPDDYVIVNGILIKYKGNEREIVIPDTVTSIGDSVFFNCSSLTSITIPNSVTSIGWNTFKNCSSLTSITIPNSVRSIGGGAFSYCSSLTSITIPDSVTSIGERTFKDCSSLTSITIPDSVKKIGEDAFAYWKKPTINASEKSYAIEYAKKEKIPYQVIS